MKLKLKMNPDYTDIEALLECICGTNHSIKKQSIHVGVYNK